MGIKKHWNKLNKIVYGTATVGVLLIGAVKGCQYEDYRENLSNNYRITRMEFIPPVRKTFTHNEIKKKDELYISHTLDDLKSSLSMKSLLYVDNSCDGSVDLIGIYQNNELITCFERGKPETEKLFEKADTELNLTKANMGLSPNFNRLKSLVNDPDLGESARKILREKYYWNK